MVKRIAHQQRKSVMSSEKCGDGVVLISEFCAQFGVRRQMQECYGLCNEGVGRISLEEFEVVKRSLKKRKLDDTQQVKRQCVGDGGRRHAVAGVDGPVEEDGDRDVAGTTAAPGGEVSLLYSDSTTSYAQETLVSKHSLSVDYLKGITLISSSSGKFSEHDENDRFFIIQSEEYANSSFKDSSPPVDFGLAVD